jgi:hypothetical protein
MLLKLKLNCSRLEDHLRMSAFIAPGQHFFACFFCLDLIHQSGLPLHLMLDGIIDGSIDVEVSAPVKTAMTHWFNALPVGSRLDMRLRNEMPVDGDITIFFVEPSNQASDWSYAISTAISFTGIKRQSQ